MNRQVETGIYKRNGIEESFSFYTNLKTSEKIKFINSVVDIVVDSDDNRYNSVIRDIAFDYILIGAFTDVDITGIDTVDSIEDFLIETDIVDIVKDNISHDLIRELNKAVDDNIAYRTGIHKDSVTESIVNLMNTLEYKVSAFDTESMAKMAKIFGDVSGELNADKVLEAYTKSDLFKKNHE